MSGVWEFKDGVLRLVENLESQKEETNGGKKKVLVHLATGEVVTSYTKLDQILSGLGWEKHKEEGGADSNNSIQFQNKSTTELVSLPSDFSKLNSVYMYDIVFKNPNVFHIREVEVESSSSSSV